MKNIKIILIMTILAIVVIAFGCGCTDKETKNQQSEGVNKTVLTVSAAASLTEAFNDIEKKYENENTNIDLKMNYGASGSLRQQIEGGAPIDVFASAAQDQMDMLAAKGLAYNETRKDFAGNALVMIVPKGNVLHINNTQDLAKSEIKRISLGQPSTTPAGKYAQEYLMKEGTWDKISNKIVMAENVKQSLLYVERNEVDAGFVFKTDATSAQPNTIDTIETINTTTPIMYPIVVVKSTTHKNEAEKYINFVTGEEGKTILGKYGFTQI